MTKSTFQNEIVEGRIDDLAEIVSLKDQDRFCRHMKNRFRNFDGKTSECFEWGWRCFKAMRSLLFSAALYVESRTCKRNKLLEATYCYGLYYSLFHASFSIICMHPEIGTNQLLHVSHRRLANLIEEKFVNKQVLPESYMDILERARVMRELTSYFVPLGGLAGSTSPELRDTDAAFEEARRHMTYSFQLSNLLGSIYWNVKNDCSLKNEAICKSHYKSSGGEIGDRVEKLVNYQPFPSAKIWSFIGEHEFDRVDARTAVRKFGLYTICPVQLLYFVTVEAGIEQINIENVDTRKELDKFIGDIW